MKDDIIKLDHSSMNERPRPTQGALSVLPSQGTANRRLRLRRSKMEPYGTEHFGVYNFGTQDIVIEDARDSRLIEKLPARRIAFSFAFLVVAMSISLLILLLRRDYVYTYRRC